MGEVGGGLYELEDKLGGIRNGNGSVRGMNKTLMAAHETRQRRGPRRENSIVGDEPEGKEQEACRSHQDRPVRAGYLVNDVR